LLADKSVEQRIRNLVDRRIEHIKSGNRELLEGTYLPLDLGRRNAHNRRDFDTYMRLIEEGFGAEVQKYEISKVTPQTPRPFSGLAFFPFNPQYVVMLTTVNKRTTAWFITVETGDPAVVLPVFDGHCFDRIACGRYTLPDSTGSSDNVVVFNFNEDTFAAALAKRIALELNGVSLQLQYDSIRALALDCFPWFGYLHLCILTDREDFDEEANGKWRMAEWRYHDFTGSPDGQWPYARDLIRQLTSYYESAEGHDDASSRANTIYRACAKALRANSVSDALKKYGFKLAADFEFGVFDPKNPAKGNYCAQAL
jgi:hypothetical protein